MQHRHVAVRAIAAGLLLVVPLTGCYQYFPVRDTQPLPESERDVRVQLNDVRSFDLGIQTVNDIAMLEGSVYRAYGDSLGMWTQWVHTQFGNRFAANGSVFYLTRGDMRLLEERRLEPVKSVLAALAISGAFVAVFAVALGAVGGNRIDPGPDPGFRIAVPIP